jgi:hypothetical protein
LLAPRPTPKLEDHLSSAVRGCLLNLFTATLHIGGRSCIRNLRTRHAVVTGTHIHGGTMLTDQNSIQKEIKSRLNLGNACFYSVQNLLSSRLLSKSLKIKIYRTIILPVVLYGCETWSLTLREERRLSVFENRVLRRVF